MRRPSTATISGRQPLRRAARSGAAQAARRQSVERARVRGHRPARPGRRKSATAACRGLFYVDGRVTSDYNTGSDLFPQKEQDGFGLVNARVGIRGPDEKLVARGLGAEPVQQGLCPGRVQLAVPGGNHLGALRRSAVPGRPSDLLAVPCRTADFRSHRPLPLLGGRPPNKLGPAGNSRAFALPIRIPEWRGEAESADRPRLPARKPAWRDRRTRRGCG